MAKCSWWETVSKYCPKITCLVSRECNRLVSCHVAFHVICTTNVNNILLDSPHLGPSVHGPALYSSSRFFFTLLRGFSCSFILDPHFPDVLPFYSIMWICACDANHNALNTSSRTWRRRTTIRREDFVEWAISGWLVLAWLEGLSLDHAVNVVHHSWCGLTFQSYGLMGDGGFVQVNLVLTHPPPNYRRIDERMHISI